MPSFKKGTKNKKGLTFVGLSGIEPPNVIFILANPNPRCLSLHDRSLLMVALMHLCTWYQGLMASFETNCRTQ